MNSRLSDKKFKLSSITTHFIAEKGFWSSNPLHNAFPHQIIKKRSCIKQTAWAKSNLVEFMHQFLALQEVVAFRW
jgi:hypothetical protein